MIKSLIIAVLLLISTAVPVLAADPITGQATWYPCTRGWCDGTPTVALAGFLGGRYTGHVNGYVEVCGDRCVLLPSVDYCQCYEGTADQRIIDLNRAAWPLVTDQPYSTGKIIVTITTDIPGPGIDIPNTSVLDNRQLDEITGLFMLIIGLFSILMLALIIVVRKDR